MGKRANTVRPATAKGGEDVNSFARIFVTTLLLTSTLSPSWGQAPASSPVPQTSHAPASIEEWKKTSGGAVYFRYRKTETFTVDQNPSVAALRYERTSRRDPARRSCIIEQDVTRVFRQSEAGVREVKVRTQEVTLPDKHVQNTQTSTVFRSDAPGDVAWERTGTEQLQSSGLRVRVTTRALGKRASSDEVRLVETTTESWTPGTAPSKWRTCFRREHPEVLTRFGADVVGYTRTTVTKQYAAPRPDGSTGEINVTEQVVRSNGQKVSRTLMKPLEAAQED